MTYEPTEEGVAIEAYEQSWQPTGDGNLSHRMAMRAALKAALPLGEGWPTREQIDEIILREVGCRHTLAAMAADAILALFPPTASGGWRPEETEDEPALSLSTITVDIWADRSSTQISNREADPALAICAAIDALREELRGLITLPVHKRIVNSDGLSLGRSYLEMFDGRPLPNPPAAPKETPTPKIPGGPSHQEGGGEPPHLRRRDEPTNIRRHHGRW